MRRHRADLTTAERREKSRVLWWDARALFSLFLIVVMLSFVTYGLFHSFSAHRYMLEQRWRARAQQALAAGHPRDAVNDLRSALAFAPDDRDLEVELARALAAAGRTREAQVYFSTLLETQPGSGIINLLLARLDVQQNLTEQAIEHYQSAIDGTWNGDGYLRRREIRLELAQMLTAHNRLPEARNLLLIAAGNAPEDYSLQLQIGNMLLDANDPTDASDVFARAARNKQTRVMALTGQARAAQALSHYLEVRNLLNRAMADNTFNKQPADTTAHVHAMLDEANGVLALYPSENLGAWVRAQRIAQLAQLAQTRLATCPSVPPPVSAAPQEQQQQQLLSGFAANLKKLNPLKGLDSTSAPTTQDSDAPAPTEELPTTLSRRWSTLPTGGVLVQQLAHDPQFAANLLALIYQTSHATVTGCAAPSRNDVLLMKIATAPDAVEEQP